ncbi:hypothetical protein ABIF93_007981 [Bradyrhizobium japonicum]
MGASRHQVFPAPSSRKRGRTKTELGRFMPREWRSFAAVRAARPPFTTLLLRPMAPFVSTGRFAPVVVPLVKQLLGSRGGTDMTMVVLNRRYLLAAGGSVLAAGVSGLLLPARAEGLAPTESMSGGANNYRKGAAIVDRIGKGGFWMSGTVTPRRRRGSTCRAAYPDLGAHDRRAGARAAESWRHAHRQGRQVPARDAADHSDLRPAAWSPRL